MANALVQYLKETRQELNHVAWPTQGQTVAYAGLVVGISVAVAAYLAGLDTVFAKGLDIIIQKFQF
jgi:preprotein translocase SecE subunit